MLPTLYRIATGAAAPLIKAYLRHRLRRGKEDGARFGERLGRGGLPRPQGKLVWLHAASVGEAMSVLALIKAILAAPPGLSVLITTGTVTAARLLAPRLPAGATHQYVPVDLPGAVERFLDHWRPDLALWVESELWPNLILGTGRRGIPLALVNGRISARSQARWQACPALSRPILSSFALCLAQDEVQAERFRSLGALGAASVGDLKTAAEPLPFDPAALDALRRQIAGRPLWLAASTHPGEEEIIAAAHGLIARDHPGLLSIIAPRHPVRGPALAATLARTGLTAARRSAGEAVTSETQVYLADTMGEMGLLFRLAEIVFIGASLVAKGGHNPFEPAQLGCAIVHGPDMRNCAAMAQALAEGGATEPVTDVTSLAAVVSRLLRDPERRAAQGEAAARVAEAGRGTLAAVLQRLGPLLDALTPAEPADALRPAPRRTPADARA